MKLQTILIAERGFFGTLKVKSIEIVKLHLALKKNCTTLKLTLMFYSADSLRT